MKKTTILILFSIITVTIMINLASKDAYWVNWGIFTIALMIFVVFVAILLFVFMFNLIALMFAKAIHLQDIYKSIGKFILISALFLGFSIITSEIFKTTPQTANIASIEKVKINGTTQYITVRGESENNPVILFLAGGPGGSQLQPTRMFLKDLESDYTIVNWEQPGSGMSYDAYPIKDLTPDLYVNDAHELTQYLLERFNTDKIYLIGESWGTYITIRLANEYPEDYYAIATAGQMVDFLETEIYCYNKALEIANDRNDQQQINALTKLGVPPYYGSNVSIEMGTYLLYLHNHMSGNANINRTDYDTFDQLFSPEYSIIDSINFFRALYYTFAQVYTQLYDVDLREDYTEINVPITMIHGKYDVNAPLYLAEDYFALIDSPDKEFILMEHSGHNPWIDEADGFVDIIRANFTLHE